MKVLGLIPARGGSKELPGKNTKALAGKPLIQYPYECAKAAQALDRIILSTDSEKIAAIAQGFGLEVPFMRPPEFAADDSPMVDVAIHALTTLASEGYEPDAIMILQPTSPLRKPEHVSNAVDLLGDNDAVCSLIQVPKHANPYYMMKIKEDGYLDYIFPESAAITRRQDIPEAYTRDGTIFLTKSEVVLRDRNLYGKACVPYMLDPDEVVNIDHAAEWAEAEARLSRRNR